jgi:hypothetical protein
MLQVLFAFTTLFGSWANMLMFALDPGSDKKLICYQELMIWQKAF